LILPAAITPVAPPFPAPYLDGARELPDELLSELNGKKRIMRPLDDRCQALVDTLKAEIRFRREAYEQAHGVVIIPERPTV
jgi:hypothetical protein